MGDGMAGIATVAVFCGASAGHDPRHGDAAEAMGNALARAGMRVVYGGGRVGLMGRLADGALAAGGHVIGVIPEFLRARELAHSGIAEMIVTDSMHVRKARMVALSDAFVSLPGGLGTLDETIEVITWRQLGLHDKPIILCDVAGSARALLGVVDAAIGMGFAQDSARALFTLVDGVEETMALLARLPRPAQADAGRV
jgi:uncharacterized protein (TIGR00730 family)